ncbi:hypothetical protein DSECCO2_604870 [anaerobic digester metagenome]
MLAAEEGETVSAGAHQFQYITRAQFGEGGSALPHFLDHEANAASLIVVNTNRLEELWDAAALIGILQRCQGSDLIELTGFSGRSQGFIPDPENEVIIIQFFTKLNRALTVLSIHYSS